MTMGKNKFTEDWISRLRDKAEKGLPLKSQAMEKMSGKDARSLACELQVHQVELEMQNEELRGSQMLLEESRDKYFEFFNFSPTGFLTLDSQGKILETNLTFSRWTGIERSRLVNQPLFLYINSEDRNILHKHLQEVLGGEATQSCEL